MEDISLVAGKPGGTYKILKIKDERRLKNRLSAMGIVEGGVIEICQNNKRQPVLIFARDTLLAIGRTESEKILIGGAKR